jgi:PAS domain S-box-containing protein
MVIDNVFEHEQLKAHPAAEEYGVGAYLGIPLITSQGNAVGTFCLAEWGPRTWTEDDVQAAKDFALSAQSEIELRLELQHREKLEEQLRTRTEAFEVLLEHISDVVTVTDRDGVVQFTGSAAEKVLGYTPDELNGTSIFDRVHPDDREGVQETIEHILNDTQEHPTVEFRHEHADGSWRLLETTGQALPDAVDMGEIIGVSRDITKRRQLEQRVRLLAAAVEQAATAVVITGPNLDAPGPEIQYVNEAMTEMTGYSEDELVGRTPRMLQGPKTDRDALDRLREQLSNGETVVDETVNYRKDGTPYHLRWRITPIWNEEGDLTHYVSVQEDITAEKNREQELTRRVEKRTEKLQEARDRAEQASRMKSALLANMSHEIRTPLTGIIGFAESIGEGAVTEESVPPPIPEFAQKIESNGRRLLDTLTAVLRLSKLEAGEMELEAEPVDLQVVAEEAVALFETKIQDAGVRVDIDGAGEAVRAWADSTAVSVVANNLLGNAIKFTEDGGHIRLRVRCDEEWALLKIVDDGIGMDPSQVPELFEPFSQASTGFDRTHEGSGLGLAVAKRIVDQMGGSISVETSEDEGTRMTVRLPRLEEQELPQEPTSSRS